MPKIIIGDAGLRETLVRDDGIEVCTGCEMPKVTIGITGLRGNLERDDGIEVPYWGPS